MKNKIFMFLMLGFFLLVSCVVVTEEGGNQSNNNQNQENPNPENPNPENPSQNQLGTAKFVNLSNYDVNVYSNLNPYIGDVSCVVPAKGTASFEISPSVDESLGDVFYFEYLIDVGNVKFPYWPKKDATGYKTAAIKANNETNITIDDLQRCESSSAYFLVENNTNSNIHLNNGYSTIIPVGANGRDLEPNGGCGVYEVSKPIVGESSGITLGGIQLVKIVKDTRNIDFPLTNNDVVGGNIYTISVNTDDKGNTAATLKAVTPFNIDTQKKIWSMNHTPFDVKGSTPCMRNSYSGNDKIVMGTMLLNKKFVGISRINEYGEWSEILTAKFNPYESSEDKNKTLIYSTVIDFVEMEDNSVIMLLKNAYYDETELFAVVRYGFEDSSLKFVKFITDDIVFRSDSKNKLIVVGNNIIITGAKYGWNENDDLIMDYYCVKIDMDTANITRCVIPSTESTPNKQRMLTSAYCDNSNIYVCGYKEWDDTYRDITQVGEIWKFDLNMENSELMYSTNNALFFNIDGNGKNFVVCGEYTDAGKQLKGCFITKTMIEKNPAVKPIMYLLSGKAFCWFNQVCQYGNKIVLCGIAAQDMDGSNSPLPFVVAYNSNNEKIWENLSYTKYENALNILPNSIGTYLLQLNDKYGNIHYVNADLLGNELVVETKEESN